MQLPILYSFRRCPYAIRARLAIAYAEISVELREIILRDKPKAMLALSTKGTVPVLQLPDGGVIDESLEIMHWALQQRDRNNWLKPELVNDMYALIEYNDGEFKYFLDRFKYSDRYPQYPQSFYRTKAELFINELETRLGKNEFLCGAHFSVADAAIFPFIRQFAKVEPQWFNTSQYQSVRNWLNQLLDCALFLSVMKKYKPWSAENERQTLFPRDC